MKCIAALLLALLCATPTVSAFSSQSAFSGSSVAHVSNGGRSMTMEYVPSGMSKEQYRKMKQQERARTQGKNLGKVGITTFKSRSFTDWQKSGGKNLFPVDPTKVKNKKDIPYMQRPGGSADDADLAKSNPFSNMFNFGKKKAEPEPEPEKTTNWWTL